MAVTEIGDERSLLTEDDVDELLYIYQRDVEPFSEGADAPPNTREYRACPPGTSSRPSLDALRLCGGMLTRVWPPVCGRTELDFVALTEVLWKLASPFHVLDQGRALARQLRDAQPQVPPEPQAPSP